MSRTGTQLAPTQLILCGVVMSSLFESVTSFLIFRGNPQATQSVLFWLLGSFGRPHRRAIAQGADHLILDEPTISTSATRSR